MQAVRGLAYPQRNAVTRAAVVQLFYAPASRPRNYYPVLGGAEMAYSFTNSKGKAYFLHSRQVEDRKSVV